MRNIIIGTVLLGVLVAVLLLDGCASQQPVATPVVIDATTNEATAGPLPTSTSTIGLLQQALNDAAPDLAAAYNLAAKAEPEDKLAEACFTASINLNNSFKAVGPAPTNLGKLHLFYDIESARLSLIKLNQDTLIMSAVVQCGQWVRDTKAQGVQIPSKFREIFLLMAGALVL